MSAASPPRVVLAPEQGFAAIDSALSRAGWRRLRDPLAPEPIVAGEPEFATWAIGDAHACYSFQPAIRLRVLQLEGEAAEQAFELACSGLARLDDTATRALLERPDVESLLLGLGAAREAGGPSLLSQVLPLVEHEDPNVSAWACDALASLGARGACVLARALEQAGVDTLDVPAFELLDTEDRRQLVRWWIALDVRPGGSVVDALRRALVDPDWELRLTAMLAVGRLGVGELAREAARVALPEGVRQGVTPEERMLLVAVRELVAASLSGNLDPQQRAGRLGRLVMRGGPNPEEDRLAMLVASLTTPLPASAPEPPALPPGVVEREGGYALASCDLPLVWVPPVVHWLGDALPARALPNPVRRVHPAAGFFLAELPGAQRFTAIEADAACRRLAAQSGAAVTLPSTDEWEMAARGPDGRRYPSGNEPASRLAECESPWGGRAFVGAAPQWTRCDGADEQSRVVCGASGVAPAALRMALPVGERAASVRVCVHPEAAPGRTPRPR